MYTLLFISPHGNNISNSDPQVVGQEAPGCQNRTALTFLCSMVYGVIRTFKGSAGETLSSASSEATRTFLEQNTACAAGCTDRRAEPGFLEGCLLSRG